jgi:hypothetical protein
LNGVEIGARMPVPSMRWATTSGGSPPGGTGGGFVGTNLVHSLANPLQIQRRVFSTPFDVDMNALVEDASYFNNAAIIDASPTLWLPGQELGFQFQFPDASPDQTLLMMYTVSDLSGTLIGTYYEGARVSTVPAPGAFALLGLGGLMAAHRRRRS